MREVTHECDSNGVLRQVVTPERLREILDRDGESYSRPDDFDERDEWQVAGHPSDDGHPWRDAGPGPMAKHTIGVVRKTVVRADARGVWLEVWLDSSEKPLCMLGERGKALAEKIVGCRIGVTCNRSTITDLVILRSE